MEERTKRSERINITEAMIGSSKKIPVVKSLVGIMREMENKNRMVNSIRLLNFYRHKLKSLLRSDLSSDMKIYFVNLTKEHYVDKITQSCKDNKNLCDHMLNYIDTIKKQTIEELKRK